MPTANEVIRQLPSADWDRVQQLLEDFEGELRGGRRPGIRDYRARLPLAPDAAVALLAELVHVELEYRLKAGEPVRTESYLAEYPELADDRGQVLELIRAEYELRRRQELAPTLEEYRQRFPQYATELQAYLSGPPPETVVELPSGSPGDTGIALGGSGPRFRPLRFHAKGGLGEVHVAEDAELHREVALKRIQAGRRDDPDSRRRFLREAEITGRLEHPGIVPVYSLGQDGEGQPCYAMRFIDGQTLQEAIRRFHEADRLGRDPGERRLALRHLLSCFVTVCNTVAYAHGRGILHRDLKPANVMLGQYGETLVVDWGLARSFRRGEAVPENGAAPLTPSAATHGESTRLGEVVGTPAYMSPEQAAGRLDELGPASDVYSLGATLYTLLTGRVPFAERDLEALLQAVQRGELAAPRRIKAGVPAALDAVCRKAMALRPADRYASALELAGEVEHFLADEPVGALVEPITTRARRWGRKHPGPVAGLAAAVLVGLLGLGISAVFLGQKNRELQRARQAEASRNEILLSIFRNLNPKAEEKEGKALRVLLGERLGDAVKQLERDTSGDPLAVAQLQDVLGNSLRELGYLEEAEGVLAKARQTRTQLLGAGHSDTLISMNNLALLYRDRGRYDEAEPLFKQVLEANRSTLGAGHPDTLISMNNLAGLYDLLGRYDEAEPLLKQVLESHRQKLGPEHSDTLQSMNNLAQLYKARGRYDEAETLYKQALEVRRHEFGPEHPDTLMCMNNLAVLYWARGRYGEAKTLLKQALEGRRQKLGPDHPDTLQSMNNLAVLYQTGGRYDEAEPLYKQVLEGRRQKLGPDHPNTLQSLNNLAGLYWARGRYDEAETLLKQALDGYRQKLGPDHPDTLQSMNNLAEVYRVRGRYGEAETLFKQALEGRRHKLGPDHPDTLQSLNNLAALYGSQKKLDRSIPLFEETLALRSKKLGPDHPQTLLTLANLGVNYRDAGRLDDGIRCLEQALVTARKRPGPLPTQLAGFPGALAMFYDQANRFAKAEPLYREFLGQARQQFGADDPRTAGAMAQLGLNLLWQKKYADAEKTLRGCLALRQQKEPDLWTTFNTQSMLGEALLGQQHYTDAEALLQAGYEGLKLREAKIPPQGKSRLTEALQRLVQLYDAWGKPDEEVRWRKELDAAKANERPPEAKKP
jgi:tetratricopeptide (TPR) repeat protein